MKENFISQINFWKIFGKIIRFSFMVMMTLFGVQVLLATTLLVYKDLFYFGTIPRTIFILISILPIFFFHLCFYVYENIYPLRKTNVNLQLKFLIWVLLLLLPAFIVQYRFDLVLSRVLYIPAIFLILNFILSMFIKSSELSGLFNLFKDIKYFSFDFWKRRRLGFEANHFSRKVGDLNKESYTYMDGIKIFQETISCPFQEVKEIIELLNIPSLQSTPISILDVGGGEGQLTKNLIENLQQESVISNKLVVVEPVDFETEYKRKVGTVMNRNSIHFHKNKFENWTLRANEKFDLIIASHSLYSVLDEDVNFLNTIISKMKGFLKPDGKIIVVLANFESRAYSFKKEATELLFGQNALSGITSTDFKRVLGTYSNSKYVDNYIDLTSLFSEYENNNFIPLKNWLAYFLRIDINSFDDYYFRYLVSLLDSYLQPLHEINEKQILGFQQIGNIHSLSKNHSRIITHKTEVILI